MTDYSQQILDLENTNAKLQASKSKLMANMADQEAHSRCQNLWIPDLAESMKGPCRLEFFPKMLCEVLVQTYWINHETDRVHHSLAPKLQQGQRPQPVILRLHSYQTKEQLTMKCGRKANFSTTTSRFARSKNTPPRS